MATLAGWVYALFGIGGIGAVWWLVRSIQKWGAARENAAHEAEKRKESDREKNRTLEALREVGRQREVASRPDKPVRSILERMRSNDL